MNQKYLITNVTILWKPDKGMKLHNSADIYGRPSLAAAPAQGKWDAACRQPGPRIIAEGEMQISAEANKAVARGYMGQVWNAQRPDLVENFLSEDFQHHDAPGVTDRAGVKNFIAATQAAMPDVKVSIEAEIAEGDLVVQRQIVSGTQTGAYEALGLPATGKQISIVGVYIFRIGGGKIAELWGVADAMSMMQQLGVIPTPEASQS
jgi:steroid delta-isomerase-like uncharacterized protein